MCLPKHQGIEKESNNIPVDAFLACLSLGSLLFPSCLPVDVLAFVVLSFLNLVAS